LCVSLCHSGCMSVEHTMGVWGETHARTHAHTNIESLGAELIREAKERRFQRGLEVLTHGHWIAQGRVDQTG